MSERIPITEASLRAALRDPRYWASGHPEREDYAAWVTDGYRALYNSGEAKGGPVHVRAYTRKRDGKVQHVGAHDRTAPPGGMVTPTAGPAAVVAVPAAIRTLPAIAAGIAALPRPRLPDWSSIFPEWTRPSLLDPPENGGGIVHNEAPEGTDEEAPEPPEADRPRHWINGHQAKHTWPPDREFVPGRDFMPDGRSAIRPEEDPQRLADEFAGKGERRGNREHVDTGRVIGTWRDDATKEVSETTRITIHHGGNGTVHIVPAPPRHVRERNAR